MRGFEDSTQPVQLFLNPACRLGAGPFVIDGARAELNSDGITATVGDIRYWVPTHLIDHIEQPQTPPAPASPPIPNPGQGGGGQGGGGRGGDGEPPARMSK